MWQDLDQGPEQDYDGGKASVLVVSTVFLNEIVREQFLVLSRGHKNEP